MLVVGNFLVTYWYILRTSYESLISVFVLVGESDNGCVSAMPNY